MERNTSVGANALLTSTESSEILSGFGYHIVEKLDHYSPFELSSDANVEKASCPPHLSLSLSLRVLDFSSSVSPSSLSNSKCI